MPYSHGSLTVLAKVPQSATVISQACCKIFLIFKGNNGYMNQKPYKLPTQGSSQFQNYIVLNSFDDITFM